MARTYYRFSSSSDMGDRVIDAVARVHQLSADRSKKVYTLSSFVQQNDGLPGLQCEGNPDAVPEPP